METLGIILYTLGGILFASGAAITIRAVARHPKPMLGEKVMIGLGIVAVLLGTAMLGVGSSMA